MTPIMKSHEVVMFKAVFEEYNNEMDPFDVPVRITVTLFPNTVSIEYSAGHQTFKKVYDLPDVLWDASFAHKLESDSDSIRIYFNTPDEASIYFHSNGEGTLYNDLFIGEEDMEWNGYFEIEDLYEEAV